MRTLNKTKTNPKTRNLICSQGGLHSTEILKFQSQIQAVGTTKLFKLLHLFSSSFFKLKNPCIDTKYKPNLLHFCNHPIE